MEAYPYAMGEEHQELKKKIEGRGAIPCEGDKKMKRRTVELLLRQFGVIACMEGRAGNGKRAARMVFDGELAPEKVDYIKGLPGVACVGTCTHRYAPEIRKTYCVVAE